MNEKRLKSIEENIEKYWKGAEINISVSNKMADHTQALVNEIRRLQDIIEDADTEASLRRHDSFDRINQILSKVDKID